MKLPKTYESSQYETDIYKLWESSGMFKPTGEGEPYSIVLPPPNANGNLHVGHGLMIPIEDVLIRYARMNGKDTLWVPGADHAGFETWVVFEKYLEKQGKTRFDFSREELYQQVWDFVAENRGRMESQVRALGASLDWDANTFTLDEKVVKTVYGTFKKLWDDGLVYRGERIVNYCTFHHTSFADIEVEFKEENGKLWEITYPSVDGSGEIVVATTRPETMLGDVAIAVHPDDEKFANMVGKMVRVPLLGREIPVVADDAVELGFGTGAVKITPAHDPLDFEIGTRHDLKPIEVITEDGKIAENADFAKYSGLEIDDAREKIVSDLDAAGALGEVKPFVHQVPHCYKCGRVIQPLLKKQWFIDVQPLAQRAKKVIENGEIRFVPEQKGQEIARYFDELRDWNISRQIPWGIPIPAFQNSEDPDDWIFSEDVSRETIEAEGKTYVRDNDTFDTWFSSGQWPFITTDYLDGGELAKFYPNSVMETGVDLARPWVARMIMLGLYATDKIPFRDVFMHGLVLDEHGKKMSKSKGNVVNPLDIIDEYGADALRMGIMMNRGAGQPQAFSPATVLAGRNFANKLWNVARFIEGKFTDDFKPDFAKFAEAQTPAEHWILSKIEAARNGINQDIANYNFAEAVDKVYHLLWDDFADWFVESSKTDFHADFLAFALAQVLKLAHPFTPFITETIWTTLQDKENDLLIGASWPTEMIFDAKKAEDFAKITELVREIRFVQSQLPNGKYNLIFSKNDQLVRENQSLVKTLANLKEIREVEEGKGLRIAVHGREVWLDISDELLYEHQQNLEKRLLEFRENAKKLEARLANKGYVDRAPKELVDETRDELAKTQAQIERLAGEIAK